MGEGVGVFFAFSSPVRTGYIPDRFDQRAFLTLQRRAARRGSVLVLPSKIIGIFELCAIGRLFSACAEAKFDVVLHLASSLPSAFASQPLLDHESQYDGSMIIETFPVGPLQCNCTILGDEQAGEAIVVDPGDEVGRIHRRLIELGLKLKQIIVTHGHIDHVGGALKLKRLTGAPILLNQNDLPQLKIMDEQAGWLGVATPETAPPDDLLTDGLIVGLEAFPAQVLHTPGHTEGSVCLHFAPLKLLIAGDTLFAGSIGRTDLPGGDFGQIIDSIESRLMALPDETKVLPGHGPQTTIGAERKSNPFLHRL
jgi:hydroxyacylglutathione hydrolase